MNYTDIPEAARLRESHAAALVLLKALRSRPDPLSVKMGTFIFTEDSLRSKIRALIDEHLCCRVAERAAALIAMGVVLDGTTHPKEAP